MPRPQDIQDLIDHAATVEGTHNISQVPAENSVPMAVDGGTTINDDWISSAFARKGSDGKISVNDLPSTVVLLVNGKIPNGLLPDTITGKIYYSSGNATETNYKLADGTDLAKVISNAVAGSLKSVQNVTSGTGGYVSSAQLSIPATGTLRLTQYMRSGPTTNCNCGN